MPSPQQTEAPIIPLVKLDKISFAIGKRVLLKNIDLTISSGKIISIIGPNGAGKSTLVKLVVGLIKPTSGTITKASKLRIGYMPQKLHIDPIFPISVKRFVSLGHKVPVGDSLSALGVSHVQDAPLQSLSGGELQRVLLARAILRKPDLLVLDEPAQGVDLSGLSELYQLIGKLTKKLDCAVLLVSHNLHLVMANTHQVICLNQHVCCSGDPEQITKDPSFKTLFGKQLEGFAVYTHHHDHKHDVHGSVIPKEPEDD